MTQGKPMAAVERREGAIRESYLAFQLDAEQYALPLREVKEVIGMTGTTPIPKAPAEFKGVIDLRGEIISVLDLRLKLGLPGVAPGPKTAIIILDLDPSLSLGVIVDRINSVVAFSPEELGPVPALRSVAAGNCLTAIARRQELLTLILDIKTALRLEDLNPVRGIPA